MESLLRKQIRKILEEGSYVTSKGNSVEYGSKSHVNDLEGSLNDLIRVRNRQPRASKARYIYARAVEDARKQFRAAKRFGIKNGLMIESELKPLIRMILEGGLKAPSLTANTVLNPATVAQSISIYKQVLDMWNSDLKSQGKMPVRAVGPVGSVAYFEKDLESNPDITYGDVDYLVAFPVAITKDASSADIRKLENTASREYSDSLVKFLLSNGSVKSLVNVPATVRSSPTLIIIRLPTGEHVQVDTIITYPHYTSDSGDGWMPGRWTPERGIKGYTIGELYTTFGKLFNLSISDRGVFIKTRGGKSVPFSQRKNTELTSISKNFKTFFRDIGAHLSDSNEAHPALEQSPGMDPNNISIKSAARGIKGVVLTLEQNGIIDNSQEVLNTILGLYERNLRNAIDKKKSRGLTDEQYVKLEQINQKVVDYVSREFN